MFGKECTGMAKDWLERIAQAITNAVDFLRKKVKSLNATAAALQYVIARNVGKMVEPPGSESRPDDHARTQVYGQMMAARHMCHLCWAVNSMERIAVFDQEFSPRTFLLDKLRAALRTELRKLKLAGGTLDGFSMLEELGHYIKVLCMVGNYVNLPVGAMLRECFESEMSSSSASGGADAGTLGAKAPQASDPKSTMSQLCGFFRGFLTTLQRAELNAVAGQSGIVWCEHMKGYAQWDKPNPIKQPRSVALRPLLGPSQLEPLLQLMGPAGKRALDGELLHIALPALQRMKAMIQREKNSLKAMREQFENGLDLMKVSATIRGLPELFADAKLVGHVVTLRQMLNCAQRAVGGQLMEDVQCWPAAAIGSMANPDMGFPAANHLAADVGAESVVDYQLAELIAHGVENFSAEFGRSSRALSHDAVRGCDTTWEMLPFAFAATFVDGAWKDTRYLDQANAHTNNAHIISKAILGLVSALAYVRAMEQGGGDDVLRQLLKRDLTNFMQCAATLLVQMKCHQADKHLSSYPLRAMFIFLDMCSEEAGGLIEASVLEGALPYSMVHAAFIDMVLGRQLNSDRPDQGALDQVLAESRSSRYNRSHSSGSGRIERKYSQ